MSYGTRIGYRYAREYPTRVRSLVLDGSWTPNQTIRSWMNGSTWNYATGQAVFSSLFGKRMASRLQKVIDGLDERTFEVQGVTYTRWNVLPLIFNNISYQSMFPEVLDVITSAYRALYKNDSTAAKRMREPLRRLKERAEPNPNAPKTPTARPC